MVSSLGRKFLHKFMFEQDCKIALRWLFYKRTTIFFKLLLYIKAKNIAKITGFFLSPANEVWGKVMCGWGDVHGCRGACMVARGNAWLPGGMHGCGGCGCRGLGACVVVGGMHAWGVFCCGGCEWLQRGGMRRIRQDTVNERAVRILLECILV